MPNLPSTKNYIDSFAARLDRIDPSKISTQDYCVKYLRHLLDHRFYYLEIYAAVLDNLLSVSQMKKEEIILIDFGAGNGLLGMFARHCGFKKVYLNDIDKSFVDGSVALAKELEAVIAGFIHGDVMALKEAFTNEIPDAIAGTDVIEHIYDLDIFFATLQNINPGIVSVFTTASNPENFFKIQKIKRLQLKDELEGGSPNDFFLFGENAHESFLKIRKDIIANVPQDLSEVEVDQIAKASRGLDKNDIIRAVNKFVSSKVMPQPVRHPTNTCNPLNSSWTERILSLGEYARIYDRKGFSLKIYAGFYDHFKPGFKKYMNAAMNSLVKILGKKIAPFIILVGSQKNKPGKILEI